LNSATLNTFLASTRSLVSLSEFEHNLDEILVNAADNF